MWLPFMFGLADEMFHNGVATDAIGAGYEGDLLGEWRHTVILRWCLG